MRALIYRDNHWEWMVMSKPFETAVIGTGFVGRAWAISFARSGANVRLWDQAEGAARQATQYISGKSS